MLTKSPVAAGCDEQCSLHGGVCDNGVCEFRCSDYAGYTCQNNTALVSSLSLCKDVLVGEADGQHCAPSELSVLQQLETAVVLPNYNRLIPSSLTLISVLDKSYCSTAAKRLACWVCTISSYPNPSHPICFLFLDFRPSIYFNENSRHLINLGRRQRRPITWTRS